MLTELAFPTRTVHRSLRSFLDEQDELLTESLQDAAENQWAALTDNADPETDNPGREMVRWWNRHSRSFRMKLIRAYYRDKLAVEKRRTQRKNAKIDQLEAKLIETQGLLAEAQADAQIAREYAADVSEAHRCRHCGEKS